MPILHVYDLMQSVVLSVVNGVGMGIVHAGIEFECLGKTSGDSELSYGSAGQDRCPPKEAPHHYSYSVVLTGRVPTKQQVRKARRTLRAEGFVSGMYSIAQGRCCVTFCFRVCVLLNLHGFPLQASLGAHIVGKLGFPIASCSNASSSSSNGRKRKRNVDGSSSGTDTEMDLVGLNNYQGVVLYFLMFVDVLFVVFSLGLFGGTVFPLTAVSALGF
jgi:hypothetical protein